MAQLFSVSASDTNNKVWSSNPAGSQKKKLKSFCYLPILMMKTFQ